MKYESATAARPCVRQRRRGGGAAGGRVLHVCVCMRRESVRARLTAEVGVHSHTHTLHNLRRVLMCDRLSGETFSVLGLCTAIRSARVKRASVLECGRDLF